MFHASVCPGYKKLLDMTAHKDTFAIRKTLRARDNVIG
jgi:hypothetical protein